MRHLRDLQVEPGGPVARRPELFAVVATLHDQLSTTFSRLSGANGEQRCSMTGWTVRQTLAHLIQGENLAATVVIGGDADALTSGLRDHGWDAAALIDDGVRCREQAPLADLVALWAAAARATMAAAREQPRSGRVRWGFGLNLESFVVSRAAESWAHALDILVATDRPPELLRPWTELVAWWGMRTLPYTLAQNREVITSATGMTLELTDPDLVMRFGEDVDQRVTADSLVFAARATRRAPLVPGPIAIVGELAQIVIDEICTFPAMTRRVGEPR